MAKKMKSRRRGLEQFRAKRHKNVSTKRSPVRGGELLAAVTRAGKPINTAELLAMLGWPTASAGMLTAELEELVRQGLLNRKGKRYQSVRVRKELRGVMDITSKGYGFVLVDGEDKGGKDVFVARTNLGGATHGDTVTLQLLGVGRGRREGLVTKVLARAHTKLCGIYSSTAAGGHVLPDNERLPYTITISRQDPLVREAEGLAVLVEITDYGTDREKPKGKIVEILGDPLDASVQMRMAMDAANIRSVFPAAVLDEAESLQELTECDAGREDLRDLPHVTIDGEDARDFDDAICVVADGSGYTLYVSIADVSYYVRPGSAIDQEAYHRGTSIYLPDQVLPMLPERLSNHLCSLMAGEDRAAFTAILHFDQQGQRRGQRFVKSMIRSRHRFTYTTIEQLLYQGNARLAAEYGNLFPMLQHARALTALLKKIRLSRGSLEFNAPESVVQLEGGRVSDIHRAARNQAHMLIEDCMLAANEAVAETLAMAHKPVLYRIHEQPDPDKLEVFTEAAKALSLELPKGNVDSRWIAEVLARAEKSPVAYIVNNLLLRSMQQARYAPDNVGHFGLGADYYLHFTSPIRRYPDLIAHRVLQGVLLASQGKQTSEKMPDAGSLAEAGLHLSLCERRAIDLERDVHSRMAVLFLHDKIGEHFTATISGVGPFNLYLELDGSGISGSVPVESLQDDYYLHDSRRFRLIGERTNRIYQLGDQVVARLEEVHLAGKRLIFSLQDQLPKAAGP
ncbi:MAG: ribonuclease R [Desulfobulbaceae bacterium]|nr:ribonuclease R [Desulfobulbaceae bacterium]